MPAKFRVSTVPRLSGLQMYRVARSSSDTSIVIKREIRKPFLVSTPRRSLSLSLSLSLFRFYLCRAEERAEKFLHAKKYSSFLNAAFSRQRISLIGEINSTFSRVHAAKSFARFLFSFLFAGRNFKTTHASLYYADRFELQVPRLQFSR